MEELYWTASGELNGIGANYLIDDLEGINGLEARILSNAASVTGIDAKVKYRGRHESDRADLKVQLGKNLTDNGELSYFTDEQLWKRDQSYTEAKAAVEELFGEDYELEENAVEEFSVIF